MEGKDDISDYRSMLDKTLASPELTKMETIHTLVKNQILKSSDSEFEEYAENVIEKRSKEMFDFLDMLRSASVERSRSNERSSWKVKEDTDEFRVMYRQGTAGTPFHSLLVEGYVNGPLDVCLCISCESDLYKKWWPQSAIPSFKVISSQCVKKVRIGEQISLVRMKVSWPLSSREALVHFFALEYLQEGLVVVLLNTISDSESIDKSTHGFTRDGIPYAEDVVRIDVVGGFAFQKVTADRSYFRTIANMDIKLDFVPPALVNFVSRQLMGSAFKLYKKEIASITKGDEKFNEALKDPMYTRIHQVLYSQNNEITEEEGTQNSSDITINNEITEEAETEVVGSNKMEQSIGTNNDAMEHFGNEVEDKAGISLEVRGALGTLEKAISMLQRYNSSSGVIKNGHLIDSDKENGDKAIDVSSHESRNDADNPGSRSKVSVSLKKEMNESKISLDEELTHSSINHITVETLFESMDENCSLNGDANITEGGLVAKRNNKKTRFCCFLAQQESQG